MRNHCSPWMISMPRMYNLVRRNVDDFERRMSSKRRILPRWKYREMMSQIIVSKNTEQRMDQILRSSRIASAASSAYSKLRGFKTKRSSALEPRKARSPQDSSTNIHPKIFNLSFFSDAFEDISENDLQDIITVRTKHIHSSYSDSSFFLEMFVR